MTFIPTDLRRLGQRAIRRTGRNDGLPGRIGLPDGSTVYFTDPAGNLDRTSCYVRIGNPGSYSDVTWAYTGGVAVQYDMPVRVVNIDGWPYVVAEQGQRDVRWSGDIVNTPYHRHDRFSANPLYLEGLAFTPFLVMPTTPFSMTVAVQPGYYYYNGAAKNYAGETTASLSAYVPTSTLLIHFIVLYLDRSDNTVKIQDGADINTLNQSAVTRADVLTVIDELDAHDWPLAAIVFRNGQTQIVAQDIIFDCRPWAGQHVSGQRLSDGGELVISAGAITLTDLDYYTVAAESGTADDLDTISGATDNRLLFLRAAAGDTITVRDDTVASGNIDLMGAKSIILGGDRALALLYNPATSQWNNVNAPYENLPITGNQTLLFSQTADVTVANTVTETTLLGSGVGSLTLPADTLAAGVTVRITGRGYISTTGTPTFDLILSLGGTEVASTGAVGLEATITDASFRFVLDIVCRTAGATGTVVSSGYMSHSNGVAFGMIKTTTTTIDTTGTLAIDATGTWGTQDASNTVTVQMVTVELLDTEGL